MEFVRPDGLTKCTWKQNADFSESPHTKVPYCKNNSGKILPNVLHAIGNTPLIKLNHIKTNKGLQCEILAKCEFMNPGGSVKDRIAVRMIEDAEKQGLLKPGSTIIETTAGNTGIGLAMACAVKGYRCIIVMSTKYSNNKFDILRALGAEIVRIPEESNKIDSSDGDFAVCSKLQAQIPNSIIIGQFWNESNPLAHYDITASEIYDQCDGKIDMLVLGAGTGGTITGIGRKLKELISNCIIVGVDVQGSVLSAADQIEKPTEKMSLIEGVGYQVIPRVIDKSVIDYWIKIPDDEAFEMARYLQKEEGILCGGSSGAALAAGIKAASGLKKGQRCVILLPDGIRNYMDRFISDQWLEARNLKSCINTHNHWWWNEEITALKLKPSLTIQEDISCLQALEIMKKNNCEHLPVTNAKMILVGMVTSTIIMNSVANRRIELDSSVSKAITKNYRILNMKARLGIASRILEIEPYLLIVGKPTERKTLNDHDIEAKDIFGAITNINLLQFIANNNNNVTSQFNHST